MPGIFIMKKRLRTVLRPVVMAGMIGIVYAIWLKITGIGIPCFFNLWTGFKCPGCGITHMCLAVLSGNFSLARQENVFLFYMLPLLGFFWGINSIKYIITGRYLDKNKTDILLWMAVVGLLIFGVYRNIFGC